MDEISITAITIPQLQRLMKQAGSKRLSKAAIEMHIEAGAPTNPDGSINLVEYGAWLIKTTE